MRYDAELVRIIDERIRRALPPSPSRMGSLVATSGATDCTVRFDGDVVTTPVKRFAHVEAEPGDRVGLQLFESEWVVVGAFTDTGA